MQNKSRNLIHRIVVGTLMVAVLLFVLLSLVPYLIPVGTSETPAPQQPFANSHFIQVAGLGFHVRTWQDPVVPFKGKVLLIHGFGGSTSNWDQTAPVISQDGYYTLAVDLPGFGYSNRTPGLNHSQMQRSQWLWQLLDQIDQGLPADQRDQPWTLVGHSMGGGTAVAMTVDQPTRTAGLVLVDGAIFDNAPGFAATLMHYPPADRWLQVVFSRYLLGERQLANFLAQAMGQTPTPSLLESFRTPLLIQGTTRIVGDLVRTTGNIPAAALGNLVVPLAAIWGEADTWVPLAVTERIRTIRPDLDLDVIPGAHHLPMETHATAFNTALLEIMARQLATGSIKQ
jgi:pimeloyl-ACP methyl ester carboxylesterase